MIDIKHRLTTIRLRLERDWRVNRLARQIEKHSQPASTTQRPVAIFNASTRLGGLSQNATFALIMSWGLRLAGVSVVHFVCKAGMSRCVLGTNPDDPTQSPPCKTCVAQSQKLYASATTRWFDYQSDPHLAAALENLSLEALSGFELPPPNSLTSLPIPLGRLALPSLRWALRRHHLLDDEPTRYLLREYIQSAYHVVTEFDLFLDRVNPTAVVVFNGIMFPEAAVRWVASQRGLRAITHEVAFQPFSVFLTDGQATAYPIDIPEDFELSPEQNKWLDTYLSRRFSGDFTMAGINFWPEMTGLDEEFWKKADKFKQIVPIFTNVVSDTSQVHASTVFPDMFAWLDLILDLIREHPETLFVIRAHPDEKRARKISRETVSDWVAQNAIEQLPNLIFIDSRESLSSYELVQRSKFTFVYNSSIGLEAALMGIPVLCGGKARYTQYPIVFFPETPEEYLMKAEEFLAAETIQVPAEFISNARKFLYYQFYRVSLPLDEFIEAHPTPGYVQLKRFAWHDLKMENSPALQVIVEGIVDGKPFLMRDSP